MGKSDYIIVVPDKTLRSMYISEDGFLRAGGAFSEYSATVTVCVEAVEDGLVSGRIHACFLKKPRPFRSLDQMLFSLEEIMDLTGSPIRDTQLRGTFSDEVPSEKKESHKELEKAAQKSEVLPEAERLFCQIPRGRLANFYIRVYARQHTSMQGIVVWAESKMKSKAFRSGMELMYLIFNAVK